MAFNIMILVAEFAVAEKPQKWKMNLLFRDKNSLAEIVNGAKDRVVIYFQQDYT